MSVRVEEAGFMVDTLGHSTFGASVVFETLGLYIVRPVVNGRPLEAPGGPLEAMGGNRGQFPLADFGLGQRN